MAQDRFPDFRLIVVPASDLRLLDEPPFLPTAEELKKAIDTMLTNPMGNLTNDQLSPLLKAASIVVMTTLLSPHSPEIIPVYRQLAAELPVDQIDPSALPRQLTALVIAQAIICQLDLPLNDRLIFSEGKGLTTPEKQELRDTRNKWRKLHEQIPLSPQSQQALKELQERTVNFYRVLQGTVEGDQTQPETIIRQLTIISHLNDLGQSPVYAICLPALPQDGKGWPRALTLWHLRHFNNHPLAADLLLADKLTAVNDRLKAIVLTTLFGKVLTEEDFTSQHLTARARYFLDNRGIQLRFWDSTYQPLIKIDQNQAQQLRNPHLEAIPHFHSFIEWFFAQEEAVVGRFLDTIPVEQLDRKKALSLLRKLLGTQAMARNHFPDRDWQPSLTHLEQLAQKAKVDQAVAGELAVLKKEKAGMIYLDQQFEARVKTPQPGETRESAISQLLHQGMTPILVAWETHGQTTHEEIVETSPYWGQVVGLNETESLEVASQLDRILPNQRVNTPGYENLLPSNINEARVILPRILPTDNHLHHLANMGVVSISQDSGLVTLIVDRETRLAVTFSPNNLPENSTLRRLCRTAQEMLTAHFDPKKLTREEERTRNGMLKTWNSTATARGLPQLTADESADSLPVLTVVGDKATKLYLKPSPRPA